MKKNYLFILNILLIIPFSVLAISYPKVLTLSANTDDLTITYTGTTEAGSHAVMCKLYNAAEEEIDLLSTEVAKNSFSGEFTAPAKGEYVIACANYEGGEIKRTSVTVGTPLTYTIKFNTNGGSTVENQQVENNLTITKPNDPAKNGYIFDGWYEDETLTTLFDFEELITSDLTLYAKWVEDKTAIDYRIDDESGNSLLFKEQDGHTYSLSIIDIANLTDDELAELDITKEEYDAGIEEIVTVTKKYGNLLSLYSILLTDEDDHEIHTGPFDIKIKITDEMKKYDTFMFVYLNDDLSTEDPIDLKIEGDYLIGTLPHLSNYALLGSNTPTAQIPKTFDSVLIWISIFLISLFGLSLGVIKTIKNK